MFLCVEMNVSCNKFLIILNIWCLIEMTKVVIAGTGDWYREFCTDKIALRGRDWTLKDKGRISGIWSERATADVGDAWPRSLLGKQRDNGILRDARWMRWNGTSRWCSRILLESRTSKATPSRVAAQRCTYDRIAASGIVRSADRMQSDCSLFLSLSLSSRNYVNVKRGWPQSRSPRKR